MSGEKLAPLAKPGVDELDAIASTANRLGGWGQKGLKIVIKPEDACQETVSPVAGAGDEPLFARGSTAGKSHASSRTTIPAKETSGACGGCFAFFGAGQKQPDPSKLYRHHHSRRCLPEREGWSLTESYNVHETLGEGAFGVVKRVERVRSGKIRVCKISNKDSIPDLAAFTNECAIQADLDHPHIVRIFDVFQDETTITLVLEVCKGGDLCALLDSYDHFEELDCHFMFTHIMHALAYMHLQGIVHRDLKPENFLLKYKKDIPIRQNSVKVIDFGFAKGFVPGEKSLTTICGTPWYMAPELFSSAYDERCDIWSAGVILYLFLCGKLPFGSFDVENDVVFAAAKECHLNFDALVWKSMSPLSKLLIAQMIKLDASQRPSAEGVLSSLWMKQEEKLEKRKTFEKDTLQEVAQNCKDYMNTNEFIKAALFMIARTVTESKVEALKLIFEQLDTDGNGVINLEEMVKGLEGCNISRSQLEDLFQTLENPAYMEYTEFLAIMICREAGEFKASCYECFRVFDTDGDRTLSADEITKMLQQARPHSKTVEQDVAAVFDLVDTDGDKFIEFDEFYKLFTDQCDDVAHGKTDSKLFSSETRNSFKRMPSF